MVTKHEMHTLSTEAYRLHSSGAGGNVILASLLAGGLLVMAVAGSIAGRGPYIDSSNGVGPSEISATKRGTGDMSAFVLMSTAAHLLPVRPNEEPAF